MQNYSHVYRAGSQAIFSTFKFRPVAQVSTNSETLLCETRHMPVALTNLMHISWPSCCVTNMLFVFREECMCVQTIQHYNTTTLQHTGVCPATEVVILITDARGIQHVILTLFFLTLSQYLCPLFFSLSHFFPLFLLSHIPPLSFPFLLSLAVFFLSYILSFPCCFTSSIPFPLFLTFSLRLLFTVTFSFILFLFHILSHFPLLSFPHLYSPCFFSFISRSFPLNFSHSLTFSTHSIPLILAVSRPTYQLQHVGCGRLTRHSSQSYFLSRLVVCIQYHLSVPATQPAASCHREYSNSK